MISQAERKYRSTEKGRSKRVEQRKRHRSKPGFSNYQAKYYKQAKYGISLEDYKKLIRSQDGKCAICQKDLPEEDPGDRCVDHDHTTGRIRGILCRKCNIGLGMFEDNPFIVKMAFDYIIKK